MKSMTRALTLIAWFANAHPRAVVVILLAMAASVVGLAVASIVSLWG